MAASVWQGECLTAAAGASGVLIVLEFDFEESVGCWVAMTSHALRRALNEELSREGITFRQWEVLAWCAERTQLSQVEVADRMGIEAPTLAAILGRMERDGWLERVACPRDRRKKRIRPTAKAEAVWSRLMECCYTVRKRAIDGLTEQEVVAFKRTCEVIRRNLGHEPDVQPAAECDLSGSHA